MELLGPKFPNIAQENGRLYVKSTFTDFSEDLVYVDGVSWRPWDARRSKVGAAVVKRVSQLGIKEGDSVLYLGAAHGYTPTFIADIVGEKGIVFCLDFSATVVRDLLRKSRARTNMIPILADAKKPETFAYRVSGVDVIIMDIAQRDQTAIFLRACERFLKPSGFGILSLKARSVDMTRDPKDVFRDSYRALETVVKVVDYRELTPLERDHAVFIIKNDKPVAGTPSAFPDKTSRTSGDSRSEDGGGDFCGTGRKARSDAPYREQRFEQRGDSRGDSRGSSYGNARQDRPRDAGQDRPRWQPQPRAYGAAPAQGRRDDSYVARRDSYSAPRPYGQSKYGGQNQSGYQSGNSSGYQSGNQSRDRPNYGSPASGAGSHGNGSYRAPRDGADARSNTDDRKPQQDRRKPQRWGGSR